MSSLVEVYCFELPRERRVRVYLDVSRLSTLRDNYLVALFSGPTVTAYQRGLTYADAHGRAQDIVLAMLESTSWKAVFGRLMGEMPEEPGQWEGSIAQFAADRFGLGTWEWIQTLVLFRKQKEEESRKAA